MRCYRLLLLTIAHILINCSNSHESNNYSLNLIEEKSVIVDTVLHIEQIDVKLFRNDSFVISQVINGRASKIQSFTLDNDEGVVYENLIIKNFDGRLLGIEKTLALATKDTSTVYRFDLSKYPPVSPLGSNEFQTNVVEISLNEFVSFRQNLADTIFRETIYYDSNFIISRILIRDRNNRYEFSR